MILLDALLCLALTVSVEARGESITGQHAVASVVLNRVITNSSDVCTEVTRPHQFPWAKTAIVKTLDGYLASPKFVSTHASQQTLKVAGDILQGITPRLPHLISFDSKPHPEWRLGEPLKIGNHYFYRSRNASITK